MKSLYTWRRDWVPVLAVALLALWEIPRRVAEGGEAAWLAAFTVLCIVPIAWRRTAPLMCLLVVATAFAFAISLGEFGATLLLSRPEYATLSTAIFDRLGRPGAANYGSALAVAVVLMALTTLVMLVLQRRVRTEF